MFSQACVKNSVHRGVSQHALGQTPTWADTTWADTRGQTTPWADILWADTPQVDTSYPRQTPHQQMVTAADGTHPTGMHSC